MNKIRISERRRASWRLKPQPADPPDHDIVHAEHLAHSSYLPGAAARARDAEPHLAAMRYVG